MFLDFIRTDFRLQSFEEPADLALDKRTKFDDSGGREVLRDELPLLAPALAVGKADEGFSPVHPVEFVQYRKTKKYEAKHTYISKNGRLGLSE